MKLSKEKHYLVNGRKGNYELTTQGNKSHCFFMDDTDVYEYFPVKGTVVKPIKSTPKPDKFDHLFS